MSDGKMKTRFGCGPGMQDSPSANDSFARLGTRSEGGWSTSLNPAPTPSSAGRPPLAASPLGPSQLGPSQLAASQDSPSGPGLAGTGF